jgi:transglutaminase-like putative cysteine protease
MHLVQMSESLGDYLLSSPVIDYSHPAVRQAALTASAGSPDEIGRAKSIFEFVRDRISHTFDAGADEVTCSASGVLAYGHGTCYAKSHLLAAMMRCSGVPAGFCYQLLEDEASPSGHVLHGLNAIYLKSMNKWVRLDARGNKPGVNVQFNPDRDMLAYLVDERLGESEDPRIFATPAESVIRALTTNLTAKMLEGNLPNSL